MMVLGLALGLAGVGTVGALIGWKAVWEPRRRRRLEREHFRRKLS